MCAWLLSSSPSSCSRGGTVVYLSNSASCQHKLFSSSTRHSYDAAIWICFQKVMGQYAVSWHNRLDFEYGFSCIFWGFFVYLYDSSKGIHYSIVMPINDFSVYLLICSSAKFPSPPPGCTDDNWTRDLRTLRQAAGLLYSHRTWLRHTPIS